MSYERQVNLNNELSSLFLTRYLDLALYGILSESDSASGLRALNAALNA